MAPTSAPLQAYWKTGPLPQRAQKPTHPRSTVIWPHSSSEPICGPSVPWDRGCVLPRGRGPRACCLAACPAPGRKMLQRYGPSPRMAAFLLSLLKPATQQRYTRAVDEFSRWTQAVGIDFNLLDEESQDFVLCDYILDAMDAERSPQACADLVAGLQKQYGSRRKFRAALSTTEGWRLSSPRNMAAPMPEGVCYATVALLFLARRRPAAMVVLLCFVGILRIGEALAFTMNDVLLPSEHQFGHCVVLLLRTAKRAAPDSSKILLWHPRVVNFIVRYKQWRAAAPGERFAPTSYTTVSRWIARAAVALGFPQDCWRSHSMRRGAATALSLRGLPLQQVMEAGRWMSEKSARLYIHKGNVALIRMKAQLTQDQWARILMLASLGDSFFDFP